MIRRFGLLNCQQAHRLLSQRMDAPLSLFDRYRLYMHLRLCDACMRVDRQFGQLRQATRRLR